MEPRRFSIVPVVLASLLGASSAMCSRPSATPSADAAALATYTTTGVVKSIEAEKKTILIAHQEIPNYMKAMTMQFDLRDASLVKGIAVGDKIEFSFTDDGQGRTVVQSIRKQ